MSAREYRIEAHGASILRMVGGVSSDANHFVREPLMTREGAWSSARASMVNDFHTVKVFRNGALVFRAFKQVGGEWIDAKTCKVVKAA